MRVIDELEAMQVFYVNIGGGEPTIRRDFFELLEYATAHHVGVKFSTNGTRIDRARSRRELAASDYVDVQISLDGATAEVNDAVRGAGLLRRGATAAMEQLAEAGFEGFKLSVVVTRHNVEQLDDVRRRSPTSTAPSCASRGCAPRARGADGWDELHPTARPAARAATTGCWSTASRCSRATRSSTSAALGRARCPGSTCAGRAEWSA